MCASCITGAVYVNDRSNVSFGGEAYFANNMATDGGMSLKLTRFYCISGNAKHPFPREKISVKCRRAVTQTIVSKLIAIQNEACTVRTGCAFLRRESITGGVFSCDNSEDN